MKKQPSLFPMFVVLSLASGSLPAAAQVNMRIAGSNTVVPVVPAIGGRILPTVGTLSNALTPIGLNAALAAPAPLVSVVPTVALPVPSALTVVTPEAAATHNAQEAAAYTSVSVAPVQKSVDRPILDTLLTRPAASVSFDGAGEKGAAGPSVFQDVSHIKDAVVTPIQSYTQQELDLRQKSAGIWAAIDNLKPRLSAALTEADTLDASLRTTRRQADSHKGALIAWGKAPAFPWRRGFLSPEEWKAEKLKTDPAAIRHVPATASGRGGLSEEAWSDRTLKTEGKWSQARKTAAALVEELRIKRTVVEQLSEQEAQLKWQASGLNNAIFALVLSRAPKSLQDRYRMAQAGVERSWQRRAEVWAWLLAYNGRFIDYPEAYNADHGRTAIDRALEAAHNSISQASRELAHVRELIEMFAAQTAQRASQSTLIIPAPLL